MSDFDLREKLIMKIQFFSINLLCLFTALNLAPVMSNAEPIIARPKPIVPKPPALPAVPTVKPPAPVEAPKAKPPVVEDRVMGTQPKAPEHVGKPSTVRPSTEVATGSNKAKLTELSRDAEIKALMEREKIDIESDAMKGLLTEHAAFDASLGLRLGSGNGANHKTSSVFETNLAKRLVGDERFEKKDLKIDDIKDLEALTCKNGKDGKGGCGHSKFNLSCRRISGFLAAASVATLSVPIGAAFYSFLKAEPDKDGKTIEVPGAVEGGGALVVKDLDKPVAGEEIAPAKESN